jgi:ABC-2 type transport system ATP-binding protein
MMDNILEIKKLRKRYRDFTLNEVNLDLPRGYLMGLIGPNGAGKTTLIKLIMNLVRADAGEIRVFGLDHRRDEKAVRARIGFVPDVPRYYDDARLRDIARAVAPFFPGWDDGRFRSLAGEFELDLGRLFKKLSQGQQTRFALALALAHDAELILMDEPTTGLDPVFRREFIDRLSGLLQDERRSVLFSTHITTDLERTADYIAFLSRGELVFATARDELAVNWAVVRGGPELLEDDIRPLLLRVRRSAFGVEALTNRAPELRCRVAHGTVVERASLEEIMVLMHPGGRHVA